MNTATKLRDLVLANSNHQQQLMHLPLDYVRTFPESYVAEFVERGGGIMEMSVVDPRKPARARRYTIVRHHSGAWVSVPRLWLRDKGAKDGDSVSLYQPEDQTDRRLYLQLHKQPRPVR
jgi:hypothetical protein